MGKKGTGNNLYILTIAFIVVIAFFTGIFMYALYRNHQAMVDAQNKIIKTYTSQCEYNIQSINNIKGKELGFYKNLNNNLEELKGVLNNEYEKIQSEYETLEIWTGLITVVFLIFSFYSLFKSESIENQSRAASIRIEDLEDKGNEKIDEISSKGNDIIDNLKFKTNQEIANANVIIHNTMAQILSDNDRKLKESLNKLSKAVSDNVSQGNAMVRKQYQDLIKIKQAYQELITNLSKQLSSQDGKIYDDEADLTSEDLNQEKDDTLNNRANETNN